MTEDHYNRGFDMLRAANVIRDEEWDPEHKISLEFRMIELGGEVGEALNKVKKFLRERYDIVGTVTSKEEIAIELADIVICADLVAMTLQVDLGDAIRDKFNETSVKYKLETRL